MDDKFLLKLSQNLTESLDKDKYYDITIEVGKEPQTKLFKAHMVILYHRSLYLQKILSNVEKREDETLTHIKLPNISPDMFQIVIRYIYSGNLSLEGHVPSDIFNILITACALDLQELIPYIQNFLIRYNSDWLKQNFGSIYKTVFENNSLSKLQNYCNDYISNEPDKILKSLDYTTTPQSLFISLIQSEKLKMDETQVWDHVIKWGFGQNPALPSDITSYSKDDFKVLKNTLNPCVPFVRFQLFSCKEFLHKVLPYKKIIPKEFYMKLLKDFLDHDYRPGQKLLIDEPEEIEIHPKSNESSKSSIKGLKSIESSTKSSKFTESIKGTKFTDSIKGSKSIDSIKDSKSIESSIKGSKGIDSLTKDSKSTDINDQKGNGNNSIVNVEKPKSREIRFIKPDTLDIESAYSIETESVYPESFISAKDQNILDSLIISNQHVELISKWIDNLDDNDKDKSTSSYGFKLLFRGSRDGLTSKVFHNICDNKFRTVTVVTVEGSDEILGGYNPTAWRSDGSWSTTRDSFIFSFEDKEDIDNHILSRVINEKKAINNGSNHGPSFGNEELNIHKKYLREVSVYCNNNSSKNSYAKPIRKVAGHAGNVEELEVFQVM